MAPSTTSVDCAHTHTDSAEDLQVKSAPERVAHKNVPPIKPSSASLRSSAVVAVAANVRRCCCCRWWCSSSPRCTALSLSLGTVLCHHHHCGNKTDRLTAWLLSAYKKRIVLSLDCVIPNESVERRRRRRRGGQGARPLVNCDTACAIDHCLCCKCFLFSISSSSTSLPFSCHLLQLFLFCWPSLLAPFLTSWTHHYCLCHIIIIIIIIVVIIVIVVIIIIERRCTRRQCLNSQPTLSWVTSAGKIGICLFPCLQVTVSSRSCFSASFSASQLYLWSSLLEEFQCKALALAFTNLIMSPKCVCMFAWES